MIRGFLPMAAALILLVSASSGSAAASDVNAQSFYAAAIALQKKGIAALFDKRVKPLKAQMEDAGRRVKAENDAARARGAPLYCLSDAQRKQGMGASEVIAMLGRVPLAERERLTLAQVWRRAIIARYPCG